MCPMIQIQNLHRMIVFSGCDWRQIGAKIYEKQQILLHSNC